MMNLLQEIGAKIWPSIKYETAILMGRYEKTSCPKTPAERESALEFNAKDGWLLRNHESRHLQSTFCIKALLPAHITNTLLDPYRQLDKRV